jgi:hypothetical protein
MSGELQCSGCDDCIGENYYCYGCDETMEECYFFQCVDCYEHFEHPVHGYLCTSCVKNKKRLTEINVYKINITPNLILCTEATQINKYEYIHGECFDSLIKNEEFQNKIYVVDKDDKSRTIKIEDKLKVIKNIS